MLLNNRYQVISTLGSGGFGETFLAQDTNMPSQRLCVVKQLKPIHNNPHQENHNRRYFATTTNSHPNPTGKPLETESVIIDPVNKEIQPLSDGYYYIVVENQGDTTLNSVRQIVPDAYLSTNKKFIYLGAVKTQEEAKQRLQKLEINGIKAYIQQQ